jgi:hypothetical protein
LIAEVKEAALEVQKIPTKVTLLNGLEFKETRLKYIIAVDYEFPSIHVWRYSPFWALASLKRRLLSSNLVFLGFELYLSGRHPPILFLVFLLIMCYGIFH